MDVEALTIRHCPKHRPMFCGRGSNSIIDALHAVGLLSCIFMFVVCGAYFVIGIPDKAEENDGCGSSHVNFGADLPQNIFEEVNSDYSLPNLKNHLSLDNICGNSELFCFPSTLPGFVSETYDTGGAFSGDSFSGPNGPSFVGVEPHQFTHSANNTNWSYDYGMSTLSNGRVVSCSLASRMDINEFPYAQPTGTREYDHFCRGPLFNRQVAIVRWSKNFELAKSDSLDGLLSPHVEINPPILEWGENYLYMPSLAFLTISNNWSDDVLHVYQPFSTDLQFFPCNFTGKVLEPGEAVSICFVFLPRLLGLSSAHLILQTSSGGFLVQAKGSAIESPYGIQPLLGLDVSSNGRWRKNLSLFNPFDENLYVEEVALWLSVSLKNNSLDMEATCILQNLSSSDDLGLVSIIKDWFLVKTGPVNLPMMALRSHKSWEIGPHISENIIEIDLSFGSVDKISGAFCMQLTRSSQDVADIIVVPLEADIGEIEGTSDGAAGLLSVTLERLTTSDNGGSYVTISLRNSASYVITVVKISEIANSRLFQIKYMDDLLLFPGMVTKVALITCTRMSEVHFNHKMSETDRKCKLLIQTNASTSQIEVLCQDILSICFRRQDFFSDHKYDAYSADSGNKRTSPLEHLQANTKVLQTAELEELVLGNWKSQGTSNQLSVLYDPEVLFPILPIGAHCTQWITVNNPSQQPVIMQLLLNSGEVIDECRDSINLRQLVSLGSLLHSESVKPVRYGFSLGENAVREAYVQPYGKASLGPLIFHPSNLCEWRSSVLIRNNLSGVEWVSLRGFGGSYSLDLLENLEPVEKIEFNLDLPDSLTVSSPEEVASQIENTTHLCFEPLTKVLYAKNTGDLLLEVKRIMVSGADCEFDGFKVQNCTPFSLKPGESKKLLISYRSNFLAPVVCRDLELAMETGIFFVPMKASIPLTMLGSCKKSLLLMWVKKTFLAVLLTLFVFLVYFLIFPQVFSAQDWHYKGAKHSISGTKGMGKSPAVNFHRKNSKFSMPTKVNRFPDPISADKPSLAGSMGYAHDHTGIEEHGSGLGGSGLGERGDAQMKLHVEDQGTPNMSVQAPEESERSSSLSNSVDEAESCNTSQETSQPINLSISTGKEKGRRRRRRKAGAGLSARFEVSSSQSGNSTPSSPLSPVSCMATPRRIFSLSSDPEQCNETKNPLSQCPDQFKEKSQVSQSVESADLLGPALLPVNSFTAGQDQPPAQTRRASKLMLSPSATFPCAGRPASNMPFSSHFLASAGTIAPHARAPGSKLCCENAEKQEEKSGFANKFTYDIWGDHFSCLHLVGRLVDDTGEISDAVNSDSNSFFVQGPQTLMKKYQPGSVTSHQGG